jgi:hypothetical protein
LVGVIVLVGVTVGVIVGVGVTVFVGVGVIVLVGVGVTRIERKTLILSTQGVKQSVML